MAFISLYDKTSFALGFPVARHGAGAWRISGGINGAFSWPLHARLAVPDGCRGTGVGGLFWFSAGPVAAATCPTVNPNTGVVTPAPSPGVDWSGCDLANANLENANLGGANLAGANLSAAFMPGAILTDADLDGANITGANDLFKANLTGANLANADLTDADLGGATLTGVQVQGTTLTSAVLGGATSGGVTGTPAALPANFVLVSGYFAGPRANLTSASLSGVSLASVDLLGAVLTGADLSGTTLTDANLSGAALANTDLAGTALTGSELVAVTSGGITGIPASLPVNWNITDGYLIGPKDNLADANLAGANLSGADLSSSNLRGADLDNADLSNANLASSSLTGASIDGTNLAGADLTLAVTGSLAGTPAALPANWTLASGYLAGPDAYLYRAALAGASLAHADLDGADLQNANLDGAMLTGADLDGIDGNSVNLSNADLAGAALTSADLQLATLTGADVDAAALGTATLGGVTSGSLTGMPASLPANWTLLSGYLLGPQVQLTNGDLAGENLTGTDLADAYIQDTDLAGAGLAGVDLEQVSLLATDLTGANLAGVNLTSAYISFFDYDSSGNPILTKLTNANLTGADLTGAQLGGVDIAGAQLADATLTSVTSQDLTGTPASLPANWFVQSGYLIGPGADLNNANLSGVNLSGGNLTGIKLAAATLTSANLSDATLTSATIGGDLTGANLVGANLTDASVANADLTRADLDGATVTGASFSDDIWSDTTCPDGTDSDQHVGGCFSTRDTTSPTVQVTGVSNGAVYITGAVPAAGCQTTDSGTGVATSAALTVTSIGFGGAGTFTATCAGAIDKAGNKAAPVSTIYTVAWGLGRFDKPRYGSRVRPSHGRISVVLQLVSAKGAQISAANARKLAAQHRIRVVLTGPGIKAAYAACAWAAGHEFRCSLRVPASARPGRKYTVTAQEKPGTSFVTAPAIGHARDPELFYLR